jgi:hypothetical protein
MSSRVNRLPDAPLRGAIMPSRVRRFFIVMIYLLIAAIIFLIVVMVLPRTGVFSRACIESLACTRGENRLKTAVVAGWLVTSIMCAVWGWNGRLPGARRS